MGPKFWDKTHQSTTKVTSHFHISVFVGVPISSSGKFWSAHHLSCKKAHYTHSQVTPLTPKALSTGRAKWILRFTFWCPHHMVAKASVHPPVLIGSPPSLLNPLTPAHSQLSPACHSLPAQVGPNESQGLHFGVPTTCQHKLQCAHQFW